MSWVLILTSTLNGCPPAIVGGYLSRDEAEAAGMAATATLPKLYAPLPPYTMFTVIAGAALVAPQLGSVHSRVWREHDRYIRVTTRVPENTSEREEVMFELEPMPQ